MLTDAQLEARKGKLTASRVAVLMNGDAEGILNLWREMTDSPEFVPEDLSDVWPVQLGLATEELNLRWFEMKNACVLARRGEVVSHPAYGWAAATLDGWSTELKCPIECKHVGGREPLEVVIDRYQPQMQWQMFVTGSMQCIISIIMGASPPIVETIERDEPYILEIRKRGVQFMEHVRLRTVPVVLPAVPSPEMANKIVDMSTNNSWAMQANQWLITQDAARDNKDSEQVLKSLMPDDAKKAHGHGVQITRDRANRLSLRRETK